jgi:hypothetical protein
MENKDDDDGDDLKHCNVMHMKHPLLTNVCSSIVQSLQYYSTSFICSLSATVLSSVQNFVCRMLDSRSLLSAAMVSKKWLKLCQADKTLRTRIRQQILQERKECLEPLVFIIERTFQKNSQGLATLNGSHRVTVSAVPSKFKVLLIRILYFKYILYFDI